MEPQTASVYSSGSVPRLRVTRNSSSTASSVLPAAQRLTDIKRSLSYPDSQTSSEDESGSPGVVGVTPQLSPTSLPPNNVTDSGGAEHRLRAVLNRFDTPSRTSASASHGVMPPSPSEPESDFDVPPAQAARASIKVLLQNALREPGDTPQKPRLTRRASFNAVASPKVNKSRRKSTSDEEREILAKRHDERRSDLSTAASLDRLRLQLTESMPSIQAASSSSSTSRPPSDANAPITQRAAPSHPSRHSKIPVSNSPVRHPTSHKEPFTAVSRGVDDILPSPQQDNHHKHAPRVHSQQSPLHPSPATRYHSHNVVPRESSRTSSTRPDVDYQERLRNFQQETDIESEREFHHPNLPSPPVHVRNSSGHLRPSSDQNTGRVSPGARPIPPPLGAISGSSRSPGHSLMRGEGSDVDGHPENGLSSRGTSASSNAEYYDRLKEAERDRQQDLERNWNRPRPQHSQSVPHRHVQGSNLTTRPGSSAGHSRPRSRADHEPARIASPSSSHSSHGEPEGQYEVDHERERNWSAPRPKWGQHPHHSSEGDHHPPRGPSPLSPHISDTAHVHITTHTRDRTSSSVSLSLPGDGNSHPHPHLQHALPRPNSRLDDGKDHSLTRLLSSSPSSWSHQEEDTEELHERERNWNAPRPKWGPHEHARHEDHGDETDRHLSRSTPSYSLRHGDPADNEREHSRARHHPNSSLVVPPAGHNMRPSSPIPHSHPHSSSHNSTHVKSPAPLTKPGARHARQDSPPPSVNGGKGNEEAVVGRGDGWNSPKASPSRRHDRTLSSPSPASSRPDSRASDRMPLPLSKRRSTSPVPASIPEPAPAPDVKKGHRRTTTELSEAMGPFPRKSTLPLSIAMPYEESDASLFADESVPPPRMSTPTFRKSHLPDLSLSPAASDIPLPPSPPSPVATMPGPASRADSDLARLQRAVTPNFTFPARQRSPPGTSVLSTPPRRSSFDAPKIEFRTPSPPLGLPDSPQLDQEAKTLARTNVVVDPPTSYLSAMETPRLPGAFGTPAPPPSAPVVSYSVEEDVSVDSDEVATTPKLEPIDAALDNNGANPSPDPVSVPETPVPPGAYRPTPTASKRKGILKVRFDGDVQSSGLVNSIGTDVTGVVPTPDVFSPPLSPNSEDVPPLSLSPSRRKGLRLVDEYGRARRFTENGEEIILDLRRKIGITTNESPTRTSPWQPLPVDDVTLTPRRRAKLRQVDALGNDVTEERKPDNREVRETRDSRKAVLSRLTRSLSDLKNDLAQEEEALAASIPPGGSRDDERLMNLAVVSKTARVERNKLARKLQLERHAEDGSADQVHAARNPELQSSSVPSSRTSWWRRKWRLALCLLVLELVVLCVGYQLASIHAKQAWLATYFDPFFPALYLRNTPPSFISRSGALPMGWSAFAISGAVQRVGVYAFLEGVARQLWEGIWSWRMEPWETWGSPAAGPPVPQPWPPS